MSKKREKRQEARRTAKFDFRQAVRQAVKDDGNIRAPEIRDALNAARKAGIKNDKYFTKKLESIAGRTGAKVKPGARNLLGINTENDGGGNKEGDTEPFNAQTVDPLPYGKNARGAKKWAPKRIEVDVKTRWNQIKEKYKGPQRLKVYYKPTGLLKKYSKTDGGFRRNKFIRDTKSSAFERYKTLGGIRDRQGAVMSQTAPTPKFDKVPRQYSKSLNAVRSSLSGIQKRGGPELANKVGKQLSGQYTPKSDYGSRGLDLIGPSPNPKVSNSGGPGPSRKRRKQSMGLRTHARINR